jgi:hypothetical protein
MNDYIAGSTSVIETVFLQDSTSNVGAGKTALAYNTSGLTCYYKRSNGTAAVSVTLANITTLGTFVSGGFKLIDDTNMPGLYEFHPPNAALASGAKWVTFYFQGVSGLVPRPIKVRLMSVDPDSANNFITGVGAVTLPTASDNATAYLDAANAIETGLTPRQSMRLMTAMAAGKLSGVGTGTITIRNTADTKNRIVATIDGSNNRTAVTLDVS